MDPFIRQFSREDIPQAIELWSHSRYVGLGDSDSPQKLTQFLERNPGFSFVAIDHDQLVATILCGHDGRRGYIHHLAVATSHRRAGLGRMLLQRSLNRLKEASILKCHAFVFQDNPFGELFWHSIGWKRRGDLEVYSQYTEGVDLEQK